MDGNVAVVTGAAAGIGRAVAAALAGEGAAVVLADVDAEAGQRTARELSGRFVRADVLADDDLRDPIGGADGLAILVNKAGGAPEPHYAEAPVEYWSFAGDCICPDWVDTPSVALSLVKMSKAERARVPDIVPAEEIASLALDLIRDDTLAGRVLIRPAGGAAELMPLEGPCG